VVFGTVAGVHRVLATTGWQIDTPRHWSAVNLTIRQQLAAVGRRASTLCKGRRAYGTSAPSIRRTQTLLAPCQPTPALTPARATHGNGSAKRWRPGRRPGG